MEWEIELTEECEESLLLVGGDKTGDGRWYERMTMRAESLLAEHLGSFG